MAVTRGSYKTAAHLPAQPNVWKWQTLTEATDVYCRTRACGVYASVPPDPGLQQYLVSPTAQD